MQATPAKLPDDTWGVRVFDPGQAGVWTGQAVTVQAKSGKSWQSVLTELVSHDEKKGVALYRKAEKKAKAPAPTLFAPVAGGSPDEGEPLPPIAGGSPEADLVITKVTAPTNEQHLTDEALSTLVKRAEQIVAASGTDIVANATDAVRAVVLQTLINQAKEV